MAEKYFVNDVRYEESADRGIISWTTDEPSDSQVELGTSRRLMVSTKLDTELVTFHAVALIGLNSDTRVLGHGGGWVHLHAPMCIEV
jgi:hypothetical protein